MYSISFFQFSIQNVGLGSFLGTLEVITRFVLRLGACAATMVFLLGFPVLKNKCARRESFEPIHDVFDDLFLDIVSRSWICQSTCTICVSKGCMVVTRLVIVQRL